MSKVKERKNTIVYQILQLEHFKCSNVKMFLLVPFMYTGKY